VQRAVAVAVTSYRYFVVVVFFHLFNLFLSLRSHGLHYR